MIDVEIALLELEAREKQPTLDTLSLFDEILEKPVNNTETHDKGDVKSSKDDHITIITKLEKNQKLKFVSQNIRISLEDNNFPEGVEIEVTDGHIFIDGNINERNVTIKQMVTTDDKRNIKIIIQGDIHPTTDIFSDGCVFVNGLRMCVESTDFNINKIGRTSEASDEGIAPLPVLSRENFYEALFDKITLYPNLSLLNKLISHYPDCIFGEDNLLFWILDSGEQSPNAKSSRYLEQFERESLVYVENVVNIIRNNEAHNPENGGDKDAIEKATVERLNSLYYNGESLLESATRNKKMKTYTYFLNQGLKRPKPEITLGENFTFNTSQFSHESAIRAAEKLGRGNDYRLICQIGNDIFARQMNAEVEKAKSLNLRPGQTHIFQIENAFCSVDHQGKVEILKAYSGHEMDAINRNAQTLAQQKQHKAESRLERARMEGQRAGQSIIAERGSRALATVSTTTGNNSNAPVSNRKIEHKGN